MNPLEARYVAPEPPRGSMVEDDDGNGHERGADGRWRPRGSDVDRASGITWEALVDGTASLRMVARGPVPAGDPANPVDVPPGELAEMFDAGPALVVGPDDVLVVALDWRVSASVMADARGKVREAWPQLAGRVLFVAGAEQLAVLRGLPNPPVATTPKEN